MELFSESPSGYYKVWKETADHGEERFPDTRLFLTKGSQAKMDAALILHALGDAEVWAEWDERPAGVTHLHCGGEDRSALVILKKRHCRSYVSDIITGPIAAYAKPSPCHRFLAEVVKRLNKSTTVNVINIESGELLGCFVASGFWWRPNSTLIVKEAWWEVRKEDNTSIELLNREELLELEEQLDDVLAHYRNIYSSVTGGIIFDPSEKRVVCKLGA